MYSVERFIGPTLIADFSTKRHVVSPFFDQEGKFSVEATDGARVLEFLKSLDDLQITRSDIERAFDVAKIQNPHRLKGLIIHTGSSQFWQYRKFESWNYAYFYSPFLSEDACDLLINLGISFVGVDAFQLEHPIINFNGHELPLILNATARDYVESKLALQDEFSNHFALLGNDILIYENLRIPLELRGLEVLFSGPPLNLCLEGLNDNALVRPYAVVS